MIDTILAYEDVFFTGLGLCMILHIMYKKIYKNEMPSNWKLFLLIVFLM
jgi:hypothetical protein